MRIYKGVFIYGERGNYTCDLFSFPDEYQFKTLKQVKEYINDYLNVERTNNV